MKTKSILLILTFFAFSLFTVESYGQDQTSKTNTFVEDSTIAHENEVAEKQKNDNKETLSDLRNQKRAAKAASRETQRITNEAKDASRESKKAYRAEKQAQKARRNADRQAEKATRAKDKSDGN